MFELLGRRRGNVEPERAGLEGPSAGGDPKCFGLLTLP